MKYTDGEISRLENTVIPNNVANIEQKITDLNQSVVNLQDVKAEKVHTHLVTDITDFPTSLPASDVHDWAKAEVKPTYTHEEVGALSSSTHIPSTLEEMTDDQNHRTVSDVEKETWNAKSDFSGSYNDLTDVPEIKQLTDDLKEKYDNAATLATANKNTLDTDYAQTKEFLDGLKKGYIEYQLTWVENERITSENGEIQPADGWKRTTYTDICDAEYIFVARLGEENPQELVQFCGAWYDENHKFIEEILFESAFLHHPATAKYFIMSYNQLLVRIMVGRRACIKEGLGSTASGDFSHAEGYSTEASGSISHVEGECSIASGVASHAEGYSTEASGSISHVEGIFATASGVSSHAEGGSTTAAGECSHAEGSMTYAKGEISHAEGTNSHAVGSVSHAEGINTLAEGESSHAEGSNTKAKGKYSHASGFCTQATHSCQYAVGCGNDPQADSLFEVGNGLNAEGNLIDDTTTLFDLKTRRNAFRVTNTGYAIAQTALQIGETAITEDQLKQLIQLITNAG